MKKLAAMLSLAALAACGGGGEENKAKEKAPAATALEAGQWQTRINVTAFRQADEGRPRLNMPVGTQAEGAGCVTAENGTRPPPELFVPADFEGCTWGSDFYMRGGRLVSSMSCRRDGVGGEVPVMVNVDFNGADFTGAIDVATRLVSDGDVVVRAELNGRRTAPACTPEGAGGNNTAATK